MSELCYECEKPGELVSPCGNERCIVRIHRSCIEKQVDLNNDLCPKCNRPIISNQVRRLNLKEFFIGLLYYIAPLLMLISIILSIFTSFDIIENITLLDRNINIFLCVVSAIILCIIFIVYGFSIYANTFDSNYKICKQTILQYVISIDLENKHMKLYINLIVIFFVNITIWIFHLIGFVELKIIFGINYFNFVTFSLGFGSIFICFIIYKMTNGLCSCCLNIYHRNLEDKIIYGVEI